MEKLYVTRHGLTEFNAQERVCGSTDIPLTETGLLQAEQMAQQAAAFGDIQRIIASPMIRAQQTAEAVSRALQLPIETDERLKEWNYGTFEGKSHLTSGFQEAKAEFGVKMPEGESVFQIVFRTYSLLEELKHTELNTILVCHGGVARVIDSYFHDMSVERFMSFFMGNCEIKTYSFSDSFSKEI